MYWYCQPEDLVGPCGHFVIPKIAAISWRLVLFVLMEKLVDHNFLPPCNQWYNGEFYET